MTKIVIRYKCYIPCSKKTGVMKRHPVNSMYETYL